MRRLPDEHRGAFQAPYGRLYPSIDAARPALAGRTVLAVGDVVTAGLVGDGIVPAVAVVDGFTARHVPVPAVELPGARILRVANPAATLTDELEAAVRDGLARPPALIVVDGEEDLAVVPLALAAPDGAALVYGQPGKGVVVSTIDPERRALARALLDLFVEE
ncbi:MAG: GTP-dependent dephospho-CoA kinase family protein [Methanospirillum sp.]